MEYTKRIRVNLPNDKERFKTGNGEGCYVLVAQEVKKLYDEDVADGIYEGKLDNDSCYYPYLTTSHIKRYFRWVF